MEKKIWGDTEEVLLPIRPVNACCILFLIPHYEEHPNSPTALGIHSRLLYSLEESAFGLYVEHEYNREGWLWLLSTQRAADKNDEGTIPGPRCNLQDRGLSWRREFGINCISH